MNRNIETVEPHPAIRKRLKIGAIGWLKHFDEDFGTTTAICDIDLGKTAAFAAAHPGVSVYDDYGRMAAEAGLDAVLISTPNAVHREMTETFLRAGVDVFLEKPMGVNRAEIDSLLVTQRETGRRLGIDFELRVSPAFRRLRAMIDAGEIGEPRGVEFVHHRGAWLAAGNGVWRTDPARSGGMFFMEVCHEIDLFRWFFGEIDAVQSFCRPNLLPQYPQGAMPDNVVTHLWFKSGAMGVLLTSHTSSPDPAPIDRYPDLGHDMVFVFTGTTGSIRVDAIRRTIVVCDYTPYHPDAGQGRRVSFRRIEDYPLTPDFAHDIAANQNAFLRACACGTPFHQDTLDAWKTHVACLAAEASGLNGFQKINVDYTQP